MLARLCNVIVFMVLTWEPSGSFEGHWSTPWAFVTAPVGWSIAHIPILDFTFFGILIAARGHKNGRSGYAKPMATAATVAIGAFVFSALWGIAHGGDTTNMRLQIHTPIMTMVASLCFLFVYRSTAEMAGLLKAILYAALFRSFMAFLFVVLVVRPEHLYLPTILGHADTLLLDAGVVILVASALHQRGSGGALRSLALALPILWTIVVNNRRLAWLGLAGAFVCLYATMSAGAARRRVHAALRVALPVVALYAAVGWGRTESIFKPLQALKSVGPESKDLSTESRNIENLWLVETLKEAPVFGLGFGQEYHEQNDILAPKGGGFPMYRYIPHNSVLGLTAFMGAVGFVPMWMVMPVTVFFAARAYRAARTPAQQTASAWAAGYVFIHANQLWGDMGLMAAQATVLLPAAVAIAGRLAVETGAWTGPGAPPAAAPRSAPAPVRSEMESETERRP